MRLAFVSPLPPAPTGIADYAADVLGLLAGSHELEVFHDQAAVLAERLPEACRVFPAAELTSRHAYQAYDAVVYQMGNNPEHGFVYPLLRQLPGLLVLHDLVLHHARARFFLDSPELRAYAAEPASAVRRAAAARPLAEYEAELRYTYPRAAERLAEAQLGTVGSLLPYAYPLFHIPVEVSRATAVHNEYMAAAIQEELPDATVVKIPMPMEPWPVDPNAVAALRRRYALSDAAFVVGAFGLLTPEKRISTLANAVGRASAALPDVRLLLVGEAPDPEALVADLDKAGVRARAVVTGRVPAAELAAHLALFDVAVQLRYPTARETSASLLRLLAQSRPVVMTDLEHLADVPAEAVLRADPTDEEGDVLRALLRLAARPELRRALGGCGERFVRERHAPRSALDAYDAALEATRDRPDPAPRALPRHWGA